VIVMTLPPTTVLPTGEIDPNTVRPGWVALLIVLALVAATFLLWRNMGKQLKKIDFDPTDGQQSREDASADGPAPSAGRPTEDSSADRAGAAEPTAEKTDKPALSADEPRGKH
jgi:cytoskeletal protein RodZ